MKKISTFAHDYEDEPTALANDIGKDIPIIKGKDAERFLKIMEENEKKVKQHSTPTLKELRNCYSYSKLILDLKQREVKELENKIRNLEKQIKEVETKENGKI